MAISSPLQSKVPVGSSKTIKKFQTILLNRTKVRREIFQQQTILQNRRIENERRKQREDELEAPNLVTKPRGAAGLIAGSAKGFFERLVGFLSYLTAGWIINNLPTWISMGKEFIARTQQMGKILGGFITNTTDIFKDFTRLLGASLTNLMKFDFLDTSGRVSTAFDELNLSVENWGTDFENVIKLITTPLTEGIASGEDAPPTGTEITDEGAYERTAPYSGTQAPQIDKNLKFNKGQNIKGQIGQSNIDYVEVTSLRGNRKDGWHGGMDIGAPTGTYIALRVDCEVVATDNQSGGYGLVIDVWVSQYGVQLRFAHNSSIIIKSGKIPAGTSFARVGSTGKSTGPHIHLEADTRKGSASYGGSMDPSRFVPLISLTKSPGKPTPAPASVSSSSTSQPQQNLMGTSSSSSSSGGGGTKEQRAMLDAIAFAEGTAKYPNNGYKTLFAGGQFSDYSKHPDKVVRSGRYASAAAGRYQFMPGTFADQARKLGLKDFSPRSQDLAAIGLAKDYGVTQELLQKEGMSMKVSSLLGRQWASFPGKTIGLDQPTKELKGVQNVYQKSLGSPQQAQVAATPQSTTAQTSTTAPPSPAQITPTGTPQNPQMSQSLVQERTGPTVIVTQNPSSPARQMMSSGNGGSSGGESSQISEFTLLNNFIKNKLLLDLAYL